MLGMWPQSRVPSFEVAFAVRYCTAPHSTHEFSSIRLGGPGGRLDPVGPLAERQRRSPHDQAEPGFELAINLLFRRMVLYQLRYLAVKKIYTNA